MGRALALADERRCLVAIDPGHVDVEQDDGKLLLQNAAQGLAAGARRDDVLLQLLKDRSHHEQLLGEIVHDQDVRLVRHGRPSFSRGSQTRG